jgi:hypothetical protein
MANTSIYNAFEQMWNHIVTALSGKSSATNLVNGSAEGSLRGTTTKAESDSYTIGEYAFAEGFDTTASGSVSHAEGSNTIASGLISHAEGCTTIASGNFSHSDGFGTIAFGKYSHAEGYGGPISITITGDASATTYTSSKDLTDRSIKVGQIVSYNNIYATIIDYDLFTPSITLDKTLSTSALNDVDVVIYQLIASGNSAHAEGDGSIATGYGSHAEGSYTSASGDFSHAEG